MEHLRCHFHRHFQRVWLAQTVSLLGDYLAMYALQAAMVFRMRGTAREMSGVLLAALIPTAVLGPVAGVFADRWNARRTMISSDVARAVLVGMLVFATSLWQFYAISFAMSCASAFFAPALSITLPRLVERHGLLKANARLQQSVHAARIISPAIAGALVAGVGAGACYWADSASFLISAAVIGTLPDSTHPSAARPGGHARVGGPAPPGAPLGLIHRNLVEGIRFVFRTAGLRFAMLSMAFGVFATGCFTALISIFVRDALGEGAAAYGTLGTLIAAGTLAGSFLIGRFAQIEDPETWMAGGLCAVGAFIALLAAVPARALAFGAFFGIGIGAAVAVTASASLLQGRTPDAMRGRVAGASASLMSMAQGAAIFVAGSAGARLGARPVYALSGLLLLSLPVFRYFRR